MASDTLDDLIRGNVAPESWDADPRNSLCITDQDILVVHQSRAVHEQIVQFLANLRATAK